VAVISFKVKLCIMNLISNLIKWHLLALSLFPACLAYSSTIDIRFFQAPDRAYANKPFEKRTAYSVTLTQDLQEKFQIKELISISHVEQDGSKAHLPFMACHMVAENMNFFRQEVVTVLSPNSKMLKAHFSNDESGQAFTEKTLSIAPSTNRVDLVVSDPNGTVLSSVNLIDYLKSSLDKKISDARQTNPGTTPGELLIFRQLLDHVPLTGDNQVAVNVLQKLIVVGNQNGFLVVQNPDWFSDLL
jgi:hypothetical protein